MPVGLGALGSASLAYYDEVVSQLSMGPRAYSDSGRVGFARTPVALAALGRIIGCLWFRMKERRGRLGDLRRSKKPPAHSKPFPTLRNQNKLNHRNEHPPSDEAHAFPAPHTNRLYISI